MKISKVPKVLLKGSSPEFNALHGPWWSQDPLQMLNRMRKQGLGWVWRRWVYAVLGESLKAQELSRLLLLQFIQDVAKEARVGIRQIWYDKFLYLVEGKLRFLIKCVTTLPLGTERPFLVLLFFHVLPDSWKKGLFFCYIEIMGTENNCYFSYYVWDS